MEIEPDEQQVMEGHDKPPQDWAPDECLAGQVGFPGPGQLGCDVDPLPALPGSFSLLPLPVPPSAFITGAHSRSCYKLGHASSQDLASPCLPITQSLLTILIKADTQITFAKLLRDPGSNMPVDGGLRESLLHKRQDHEQSG